MNLFGHAWVAAWFSVSGGAGAPTRAVSDAAGAPTRAVSDAAGTPARGEPFLLGSMLPDLASALRTTVPGSHDAELAAGVRLHHETDRVFHATATFQALEQRARSSLSAAGISKGPRRALAHIGVEFLIDDELGPLEARAAVIAGYTAALRFGASPACRPLLHWSNTADTDRFGHLCRRLASYADATHSSRRGADRDIAARLVACLAGRPRLELERREEAALEPWLAECRPAVAAATPHLLAELARGLDAPGYRLAAE
jgi:hypothetical protein